MRSALFALLLVSSACATRAVDGDDPEVAAAVASMESVGVRVLTKSALERLIVGRTVSPDFARSGIYAPLPTFDFRSTGEFVFRGHRNVAGGGRYYILQRSLCLYYAHNSDQECWMIGVDTGGRYHRKFIGAQFGAPDPIVVQ